MVSVGEAEDRGLSPQPGRRMTLLVATPTPVLQEAARRALAQSQHQALLASSLEEVEAAVLSGGVDAILLGVPWPGGAVAEAVARMRAAALRAGHYIPIIGLGPNEPELSAHCRLAGMDGFVGDLQDVLALADAAIPCGKPVDIGPRRQVSAEEPRSIAALATQLGVTEEFVPELVQVFVENLPAVQMGLREAFASGDAAALALVAHRAKGSLSFIGASLAMTAAGDLEQRARTGDLTLARELCERLDKAITDLLRSLQPLCPNS